MIEFLFLRNKYDRILTYNIHFMIIALYYHSKIPIDFFLNKKEKMKKRYQSILVQVGVRTLNILFDDKKL